MRAWAFEPSGRRMVRVPLVATWLAVITRIVVEVSEMIVPAPKAMNPGMWP